MWSHEGATHAEMFTASTMSKQGGARNIFLYKLNSKDEAKGIIVLPLKSLNNFFFFPLVMYIVAIWTWIKKYCSVL